MRTKNILIAAILILSIFLITYIFVFHNGLSSNHEEWGSFGSYIGGIGGIILSCSILYYTYLIDKEHKSTEKTTQILKLIDVVGESLSYLRRWKELNFLLENGNVYDRGHPYKFQQMSSERNGLEIKIWANYKTAQVLAHHLFQIDIPDVDVLHKTEGYFIKVFNQIKK